MFFRKPEFSYKPSTIANEPNIEQSEKIPFTKTWYINNIFLQHYIKYGKITKKSNDRIEVFNYSKDGPYDFTNFSIFKGNIQDSDFDSLKEGQEIAILYYTYNNVHNNGELFSCMGICDKNQYDNPIRDSQKLPKGWIHEPYYTISIRRGTLVYETDVNSKIYIAHPYMRPDDTPNTQYAIKGENIWFDKYKTDGDNTYINSRALLNGDRIVELTFTITLPDDKIETRKIIINEDEYDKRNAVNEITESDKVR